MVSKVMSVCETGVQKDEKIVPTQQRGERRGREQNRKEVCNKQTGGELHLCALTYWCSEGFVRGNWGGWGSSLGEGSSSEGRWAPALLATRGRRTQSSGRLQWPTLAPWSRWTAEPSRRSQPRPLWRWPGRRSRQSEWGDRADRLAEAGAPSRAGSVWTGRRG